MGKMIGIDLGTTNSVVAIVDGPMPRVVDNKEAKSQTRSVVGLKKRRGAKPGDSSEILVGDPALDNWDMAPRDTIISIKRLMGRGVADPEVQNVRASYLYGVVEPSDGTRDSVRVVIGGKQYSPIDVSAMVLRKLKEDAEFRLGEEVTHAVITVPAYFSQIQRHATRQAGLQAGLKVMKILEEPTAAAIAFGMDTGQSTEPKMILVYDLGGGTFDISVLMWAGNVFAPLTLEGDMWLGGDNFDQVLVDQVVRQVREEYGIDATSDMRFMVAVKKAAQAIKERLSSARSADLVVTGILKDSESNLIDVVMEITREEFERMIQPLVDRTVSLARKALQNAGYAPEQIDYVLMAGNSTNIPLVQRAMEEMFGPAKVIRKIHPKHSVAMGAALLAAKIGGVVCQAPSPADPNQECGHVNQKDATACARCGSSLQLEAARAEVIVEVGGIAPFSYGTQTAGDKFNLFIKKGDPFPTEDPQAQTFFTRAPNARMISIPIYGGDNLEKASANEKQGETFAILPTGLPQETPIRIKVWLDDNGVFELSAHLEDGTDLKPWIVKGGTDAKVIQMIEKVEQTLAQRSAVIPPVAMNEVEKARSQVYDVMKKGNFDGALKMAEQLENAVEEAIAGGGGDELQTRLENMVNFAEFISQQYGWALDANLSYQMNNLVEEARSALEKGKRGEMEAKAAALQKALEQLPEMVTLFIAVRGAIMSRIHPTEPALAADLLTEMNDIENAFRSRKAAAPKKLEDFLKKVTEALEKVGKGAAAKCSNGHEFPAGARHCPTCGEDTWLLAGRSSESTTGGGRRRR